MHKIALVVFFNAYDTINDGNKCYVTVQNNIKWFDLITTRLIITSKGNNLTI